MNRFDSKNVIVTGAGSGFGEAIARRFASEGGRVTVADIDESSAERVAAGIRGDGGSAIGIAADVRDEAAVAALVQGTTAAFGGLIFSSTMPAIRTSTSCYGR